MSEIELSALRGNDVLGFLAALGTLRLCSDDLGDTSATLAWPEGSWAPAVLCTTAATSTAELAGRLFDVVEQTRASGQLLAHVDGLPIASQGATDPMNRRLSVADGRRLAMTANDMGSSPAFGQWLRALVATSGLEPHKDDASRQALVLSPVFDVGPGTVHVCRTLGAALAEIASRDTITCGLTRWRRTNTIGAYLDHRADREKAAGQDPRTDNYPKHGEPGATWLALMSTPLFDLRATDRGDAATVGWLTRPRRFSWPVWTATLTVSAVSALLDHPSVRAVGARRGNAADGRLGALSVTAMFEAERRMAGNYAAALGPARQIWPGLHTP